VSGTDESLPAPTSEELDRLRRELAEVED